jgi:hypothetical protein
MEYRVDETVFGQLQLISGVADLLQNTIRPKELE